MRAEALTHKAVATSSLSCKARSACTKRMSYSSAPDLAVNRVTVYLCWQSWALGDGGSERMSLMPQLSKLLSAAFAWPGGSYPRLTYGLSGLFILLCRLFFL